MKSIESVDDIKLKTYEKFIQKPLPEWDVDKTAIIWPQNGWTYAHHGQSNSGIGWLANFKHTINTQIEKDIASK